MLADPLVGRAQASLERLRTGLSRSSEGLKLERRPDGITKVQLQGRFQNASVMGADGKKLSKSLGNYTDPNLVMDEYSADALRFVLLNSPV